MSKAVLISIQPCYVFLIIAKAMGWNILQEKTVEVRKTIPRDKDWNRKAIIYCSKNKKSFAKIPKEYQHLMESFLGKVIGEFICDEIVSFGFTPYNHGEYMVSGDKENNRDVLKESCLAFNDMYEYIGEEFGYAWHVSDIKIYENPKELNEFFVIDKNKLKECPYRERIFQNPEFTNGNYLLGGYSCSKTKEIDFCRCGCDDVFKSLTRPTQSWCYVERLVDKQ